jgi:hypothetical protein
MPSFGNENILRPRSVAEPPMLLPKHDVFRLQKSRPGLEGNSPVCEAIRSKRLDATVGVLNDWY